MGDADIDSLKKMEPLQGRVEWSTWRSKLEAIFDPIFATVPHISVSPPTFLYSDLEAEFALLNFAEFEYIHGN